jgi:hypothetical protein
MNKFICEAVKRGNDHSSLKEKKGGTCRTGVETKGAEGKEGPAKKTNNRDERGDKVGQEWGTNSGVYSRWNEPDSRRILMACSTSPCRIKFSTTVELFIWGGGGGEQRKLQIQEKSKLWCVGKSGILLMAGRLAAHATHLDFRRHPTRESLPTLVQNGTKL